MLREEAASIPYSNRKHCWQEECRCGMGRRSNSRRATIHPPQVSKTERDLPSVQRHLSVTLHLRQDSSVFSVLLNLEMLTSCSLCAAARDKPRQSDLQEQRLSPIGIHLPFLDAVGDANWQRTHQYPFPHCPSHCHWTAKQHFPAPLPPDLSCKTGYNAQEKVLFGCTVFPSPSSSAS